MKVHETLKALLSELKNLGPMLPGTLSKQYNVCGKSVCRCKDPNHPIKHGPYYQLSFTIGGRSSTKFIKSEDVQRVRTMSNRWKRFKQLERELAQTSMELLSIHGVTAAADIVHMMGIGPDKKEVSLNAQNDGPNPENDIEQWQDIVPLSAAEKALIQNRDRWKSRARERTRALATMKNTIRDLRSSRASWKEKAREARERLGLLIKESKISGRQALNTKKNCAK